MTVEKGVVLVDDHEVVRVGLRAIIEATGHYRVVAEAGSVREASRHLDGEPFDLVIVDYELPGVPGTALVRELKRLGRKEPSIVITVDDDLGVAAESLAAGALGVAVKSDPRATLVEAIERVTAGHRFVSPQLDRMRLESLLHRHASGATVGPLAALSAREREVFDLFVRGFGVDAIARELCISSRTVETHRGHIFVKLNVHSMAELIRFAFMQQLRQGERAPRSGVSDARVTANLVVGEG